MGPTLDAPEWCGPDFDNQDRYVENVFKKTNSKIKDTTQSCCCCLEFNFDLHEDKEESLAEVSYAENWKEICENDE